MTDTEKARYARIIERVEMDSGTLFEGEVVKRAQMDSLFAPAALKSWLDQWDEVRDNHIGARLWWLHGYLVLSRCEENWIRKLIQIYRIVMEFNTVTFASKSSGPSSSLRYLAPSKERSAPKSPDGPVR
jgi:hypothetical protein